MFEYTHAFSGFAVKDSAAARAFYGDVLGLQVSEAHGMLRLHITGSQAGLGYRRPDHVPAAYTVLNFPVDDVSALAASGVGRLHYSGMNLDEKGIMRGQKPNIAWFADPAGNILSVLQDP
ncbi:VOC family protein [Deinococcus humi]|uniref:Catechol 2,3-dioxygenase-like lactoylglutathione lyase family enzyme n=1 Tax=Deinococcus humi TaxID=662880 RepID=A0A7W8K049_9DEIO|nr:VOC family protein [Deinococcus humi]MBB5366410.1 catechol 2,3-dioxygenase-like lactoylglutathione lyase family enzyme [Deinococcus humi]GGO41609.1 hypothetical protein GCM10008949_52710 [Deinococcus humi]